MNPISAFLVRQIVAVFFFYGLAFFSLGLVLLQTARRASRFRFVQAIPALAAFGLLHGGHEWLEMFQHIAAGSGGHLPTLAEEIVRQGLLTLSFLCLLAFGLRLVRDEGGGWRRVLLPLLALAGLWLAGTLIAWLALRPTAFDTVALADVLARYTLGIPGSLLGAWVLMVQQRAFREHGLPRFGRDLVWCAAALLLYGTVGQLFVRPSPLPVSQALGTARFLEWFGIPIQLFRAAMATVLTVFMLRALQAFEFESQRLLEAAHSEKLAAQAAALERERHASHEMERLNEELRLVTAELSLLLELSNLLAQPMDLSDRLQAILARLIDSLKFPSGGLIGLVGRQTGALTVRADSGLAAPDNPLFAGAAELAEQSVAAGLAVCRHVDGVVVQFNPEDKADIERCRLLVSPVVAIAFPLMAQRVVIGAIALVSHPGSEAGLAYDEFTTILGVARQLGLSIENARLSQEAQERERRLAELLRQVVGAQESERRRIALELHDATGQSLTAIALGLRGVQTMLTADPAQAASQVQELTAYSSAALGELRHLIADLRPSQLDDLGLPAALQWYAQEFEKRYQIPVELILAGRRQRLPNEIETVLFRVTQEALTNVAKHARASRVSVELSTETHQASVTIQDDGRGFDPAAVLQPDKPEGWGLMGIQERALLLGGECQIDASPGRGARIRVTVPIRSEVHDGQDTAGIG